MHSSLGIPLIFTSLTLFFSSTYVFTFKTEMQLQEKMDTFHYATKKIFFNTVKVCLHYMYIKVVV